MGAWLDGKTDEHVAKVRRSVQDELQDEYDGAVKTGLVPPLDAAPPPAAMAEDAMPDRARATGDAGSDV